jgi:hypothetical protein
MLAVYYRAQHHFIAKMLIRVPHPNAMSILNYEEMNRLQATKMALDAIQHGC